MSATTSKTQASRPGPDLYSPDLTDWDHAMYRTLVSTELSDEQRQRIVTPDEVYPRQESVIAVHWHPEFVPIELIRERIAATFPNRRSELIIPTQHNVLTSYDDYTGVEVDCYSASFNLKVQLLVHFQNERVQNAVVFKSMLAHTFRYRSQQLFEFMDTIVQDAFGDRMQLAADRAGADEDLVRFVRVQTRKLYQLLQEHEQQTPAESIRNKLLLNYIDAMRDRWDERVIHHAVVLLRAVKKIVKEKFSNAYFYATEEVIEEVRSLGGGIVIPHPEQFWPILLAQYDVDGYEVWNPQSRQYTDFLVQVVNRQNKERRRGRRQLLIFMGDDCHMGEKVKDPRFQDVEKAGRQIGVQPPWEDMGIRKSLILGGGTRRAVIEEYRNRLAS